MVANSMQPTPAHPSGQEIGPVPNSAATPMKPSERPMIRQTPNDSRTPKKRCSSAMDSGTMAIRMPVIEELIQRSPREIDRKGNDELHQGERADRHFVPA